MCCVDGSPTLHDARLARLHCTRKLCTARAVLTKRAYVPCVANRFLTQLITSSQLSRVRKPVFWKCLVEERFSMCCSSANCQQNTVSEDSPMALALRVVLLCVAIS